jgi:hypothetical protein
MALAAAAAEPKRPRTHPAAPLRSADEGGVLPSMSGRVDARQYGAVGDGATDDTPSLQNALAAAQTKGPICFLPPGHYRVNPNFWTRMKLKPGFPKGDIKAYLEKNLVGFKIGKTDWEYISNSFVIFPLVGFHFDDFGHGPGNAVVTQSGADLCTMAVRVDRTQGHAGVQFVNGQFMSTLHVGPNNQGPVRLTSCGFWPVPGTHEQLVKLGPSTLMVTACHFAGWDSAGKGVPCVRAAGGRLTLSGCEFMAAGKQAVVLEKGLKAAAITGCLFRGERPVADRSGADVQIALNATH